MTHERVEELIEARGREVERQLLQDHLDLRALREEQALAAAGHAVSVQGRRRVERGRGRRPVTVLGTVTVRRLAFRAPGRSTRPRPVTGPTHEPGWCWWTETGTRSN